MTKFYSYGRQCIEDDDIQAVVEVLKSSFLTQGPKVREFEQRLADYCGAAHAVVFSSGTAALHGAYFAAGLSEGDEFITSPITFVATANAGRLLGATPVFVDVESDTANIDCNLIEAAITDKTRAIVPIHYSGQPVDMESVGKIARARGLAVIEDACHALGARHRNETVGSCEHSDMAVFSFHPVKSITTGEGGAVLTNSDSARDKMEMFRRHGITADASAFRAVNESPGPWYHEMHTLANNYRLTDLQCALGISQLAKLDRFVSRRREIVRLYARAFEGNDFFDLPVERDYASSAWHLYPVRMKDSCKALRKDLFAALRERSIGVQVHYIPVHTQPYYQDMGWRGGNCPAAEDFYQREVSLPIFPTLSDEDADYVSRNVLEAFREIIA